MAGADAPGQAPRPLVKPEAVLGKPAPCAPSQMARRTEETGPCRRDPSLQPQHAPAMSQKSSGHSPTQPRAGARLHMAGWGPAAHGPRQPAHTQQGHCTAGGAQQPRTAQQEPPGSGATRPRETVGQYCPASRSRKGGSSVFTGVARRRRTPAERLRTNGAQKRPLQLPGGFPSHAGKF